MTHGLAPDIDIAEAADRGADGSVRRLRSDADDPGEQVANALTAILLHAEAIRRRSADMGREQTEIVSSVHHIVSSAKQAWNALGEPLHDMIHGTPTL